jgi:hypothetical protein
VSNRAAAAIALAVIVAYAHALSGSFQFDDWNVIVDNPAVHSWSAWWDRMPGIRPLLKATYVANWVSGWGVEGFRGVNIVLHLVNTVLVTVLVRQVLEVLGVDRARAATAAFVAAALFALHPAQTEAVTYISGRSVALMAMFQLAALVLHLRSPSPRGTATALLLFLLAMTAKETAWTLPFAVAIIEAARPGSTWRGVLRRTGWYWVTLAGLFLAAMAIPGYRFLLSRSLETRTLGENLLTQIDGVFYLLSRPMLLLHTNIDPDLPARTHWTMPLVVEAVVLLAILTVAVWQWRRRPWLGLGLLWPFAMLLATNSVLPRLDVANDRQLYLALVGPTWVVAMLLLRVPSPKLSAGLTAAVAGVLLAVTAQRNGDYRTEVSLWEATAKVSPGKARVWNNLGFARQTAGDLAGARTAYERALALDPEDVKARINLGTLDLPERPASVPRP